jgi:uncharacterized UBP type Zn finger protein
MNAMVATCEHAPSTGTAEPPASTPEGCTDCLAAGEHVWAHLRLCLACGNVGCCDSSPHRHATAHHRQTGHPVMRSFEPGEHWRWCYLDQRLV